MTTILSNILLMPATPGQSSFAPLIMMLLVFVVFYFFMIRPQMKRQKELVNYRNSLKKGDKVITTGGIYGRIHEVNDLTILLEVDNNINIKVDKSAVIKDPSDLATQQK
jgi:preprotein translocase subunit YajC